MSQNGRLYIYIDYICNVVVFPFPWRGCCPATFSSSSFSVVVPNLFLTSYPAFSLGVFRAIYRNASERLTLREVLYKGLNTIQYNDADVNDIGMDGNFGSDMKQMIPSEITAD